MLKIHDLHAGYGDGEVLTGVDLQAEKGKIVCLLGRNGVGKTTLLRSIMGLIKVSQGLVSLDDTNLTKLSTYQRARAGIGYVPQGRDIFPQMTVEENLLLGLEVRGGNGKIEDRIFELFPVLKAMLSRKGGDLSGGQQQQLAIARALMSQPRLLILDEPTEGIQPSIIQDIGRVITRLKNEGDMMIFIVEQYLEFVLEIADYCYVMEKGSIVLDGPVDQINVNEVKKHIAI
ncbi:urea ABC transporter ATP-binding subunit UrtE [Ethanoligenens sp.]|uniref:urea ABC transporter ATP-binding subunit UrtE n=1 Tax=Ethanoligenens sp. TaxID=2099655 RepID=UPI0039EB2C69